MEAPSNRTLPPTPDVSPAGQLALPGASGQLGLDRRVYGHPRGLPGDIGPGVGTEARSAEPLLGPQHALLHETPGGRTGVPEEGPRGGPVLRGQLALDLADTEKIPQLSLWERLDRAHALHPFESRAAKCHRTRRCKLDAVNGYRTARGSWSWSGLVQCDHWACPKCGTRRARDASSALGVAIPRWIAAGDGHDVWMLTLAPPHHADDDLAVNVDRLYAAHALFLRSAAWRAFAERFGVVGEVRVIDATFGGRNGAHPHFHIALFLSNAVAAGGAEALARVERASYASHAGKELARERAAAIPTGPLQKLDVVDRQLALDGFAQSIWPAWREALITVGVPHMVGGHALKLTPADNAAHYFVAWGLADEVGATPSKRRSHLRLLDAYAVGYDEAGAEYLAWCDAMRGRQWVTGIADLRRKLKVTDDDMAEYLAEVQRKRDVVALDRGEEIKLVPELYIAIPSMLFPAALSVGWGLLNAFIDAASLDGKDAQHELISMLRAESLRLDLLRTRNRAGPAPPH